MSSTTHWQQVYRRNPADSVSWYQAEPSRSLAWIREVAPDRSAAIIDVGGGASTLADHLIDAGYTKLTVLDLADDALSQVRSRLGARAVAVEWVVGDALDLTSNRAVDVWHDRAVLHFLTEPAGRRRYAEAVRSLVRPGGHVIIAGFAQGGPTRCSGLSVEQSDCAQLGSLLGANFRCIRDETERHVTPTGGVQRFQYCLFERQR